MGDQWGEKRERRRKRDGMQQPTLNLRRVDAFAAAADILCHFRLSRHILPGCGDGERWWAEVPCEAGHCDDVVAVVSGRQTWLWVPQSSQMYTPSSTWLNDSLSQTRHRAGIERGRRGREEEGGREESERERSGAVEWTHLRLLVCVAPGAGVWVGWVWIADGVREMRTWDGQARCARQGWRGERDNDDNCPTTQQQ